MRRGERLMKSKKQLEFETEVNFLEVFKVCLSD